jgi:hypothetical protein
MKKVLHLSLVLIIAFSLTGCLKKEVYIPINIGGSWVLNDASKLKSYGWQTFNSGFETGVFDLYNNGSAAYSDNLGDYKGNWYIADSYGSYYDESGYYRSGYHQSLHIHMYDSYNHSSIDLDFENVVVYTNHFVTTDYYNGYVERYEFARY